MPTVGIEVVIVIILVLINGFLAMSEMSIVSARKVRLQQQAESGSTQAAAALDLAAEPNRFLSTVQIGITLVGILAGAFGGARLSGGVADALANISLIENYADAIAFVIVVSIITYLSLVIGELVPKRLALQHSEGLAAFVARPMMVISRVATPLVWLLGISTDFVLSVLRVQAPAEPSVTEEEVRILLHQGTQAGVFEHTERDMVMEIFRLGDRYVGEIMTPRFKITVLDHNATPDDVRQVVADSDHTTFPVVDGDLDQILGVVSIKNLWSVTDGDAFSLTGMMHQPIFVPERLPVLQLLETFRQSHEDMALVVDEYGAVEGLITLRDVVDEIVGEVEPPEGEQPLVQREDGSWLVDGSVSIYEIDEVTEVSGLEEWAEERYQTIAGFVMGELGRVPIIGDVVVWQGRRFEVVDMDGHRVDRILISRAEREEPKPGEA